MKGRQSDTLTWIGIALPAAAGPTATIGTGAMFYVRNSLPGAIGDTVNGAWTMRRRARP